MQKRMVIMFKRLIALLLACMLMTGTLCAFAEPEGISIDGEDLDTLESLANTITEASLCGLGQTACKPVLSTLKYFRNEYLAHVVDKHCPHCNGRKRHLEINPKLCRGCGKCKRNCPMEAISGELRQPHTIDVTKCIHCGACWGACPFGAIDAIEEEG